jgi:hypothetical protein
LGYQQLAAEDLGYVPPMLQPHNHRPEMSQFCAL